MIIASHVIWSAYGFWLPNDERGSWSEEVWAEHLKRFGPATKVQTRRSVAHRAYDRSRRAEMGTALKYPPVRLTGEQARAAGRGFEQEVQRLSLVIHACAVMQDHVHLVIANHALDVTEIAARLKSAASRRMTAEGIRPLARYRDRHGRVPTPWAEGGWVVYLDSPAWVRSCVEYVEMNPVRLGLRRQRWRFVTGYG